MAQPKIDRVLFVASVVLIVAVCIPMALVPEAAASTVTFWAFALAVLPVTLLIFGGLRAIQSAVLVVSLPVVVIGVLMTISLFKTLRGPVLSEPH